MKIDVYESSLANVHPAFINTWQQQQQQQSWNAACLPRTDLFDSLFSSFQPLSNGSESVFEYFQGEVRAMFHKEIVATIVSI